MKASSPLVPAASVDEPHASVAELQIARALRSLYCSIGKQGIPILEDDACAETFVCSAHGQST